MSVRSSLLLVPILVFAVGLAAQPRPFAEKLEEDAQDFMKNLAEGLFKTHAEGMKKSFHKDNDSRKKTDMPITLYLTSSKGEREYYWIETYSFDEKKAKHEFKVTQVTREPGFGFLKGTSATWNQPSLSKCKIELDGQSWLDAIDYRALYASDIEKLRDFGCFLYLNKYLDQGNIVLTHLYTRYAAHKDSVLAFMREQHGWAEEDTPGISTIAKDIDMTLVGKQSSSGRVLDDQASVLAQREAHNKSIEAEIERFMQSYNDAMAYAESASWAGLLSKRKKGQDIYSIAELEAMAQDIDKRHRETEILRKARADIAEAKTKGPKRKEKTPRIQRKYRAKNFYDMIDDLEEIKSSVNDLIADAGRLADEGGTQRESGNHEWEKTFKTSLSKISEVFPLSSEKRRKEPAYAVLMPSTWLTVAGAYREFSRPDRYNLAVDVSQMAMES
ncbi:MAG: hypothetical protein KDB07_04560, partial [Planctomycetes bacterium]|nr:hypothetical protein [Planctomycetota bacterium]